MTVRSGGSPLAPVLRDVDAVVFDTDGVITDSARVHAAAWKDGLRRLSACPPARGPDAAAPLRRPGRLSAAYVDGRSRLDGAAAFLASRGLDPPPRRCGLSPRTRSGCSQRGCASTASTPIRARCGCVHALRGGGSADAAASASRHARELLIRAGVLDLFDALVDGGEAARLGLPGKPDPDLFLEAARRLGASRRPRRRRRGRAGRCGGGPARWIRPGRRRGPGTAGPDTGARLLRHGADIVVHDLAGGAPT